MLTQVMFNVGVAFVWILLNGNYTIQSFFVGYLLGLVFLYLFRNQLGKKLYIYKWWAALVLLCVFLRELIKANFEVIYQVLKPKLSIMPGFVAYRTELESEAQVVLLANMITLTPGSLSVELSPDNKTIYLHLLCDTNKEDIIRHIKTEFEDRIKEVFN